MSKTARPKVGVKSQNYIPVTFSAYKPFENESSNFTITISFSSVCSVV